MKKAAQRYVAPAHDAFPLRTVAAMTGLTPDLIRAWEKRYAAVTPIRGARGARLYTVADIAHLRLLGRVVGAGRSIGDVAGLSPPELKQLAGETVPKAPERRDGLVGRVIEHLEQFDHAAVARVLGDALIGLGCTAFVRQVAAPLLREVGDRWSAGTLAIVHEHLFSGILRNLLASLVHARIRSGQPTAVLATPAGERHDLGLLLVALLALDAGLDVTYLGADLPAAEIVTAARRSNAILVAISLVSDQNRSRAVHEVQAIQRALPGNVELWLGGRDANAVAACLKSFRGVVVDTLSTAESDLTRLGAMAR
jgi:DNA-binding transcriptional MerR regulator/methylmalonyl-CoA mutase cobalamin-binding subunit